MADNNNSINEEEAINQPSDAASDAPTPAINASDDVPITQETETENTQQDLDTMEVHHHAHNPAEPHHKKNWKAYGWEFLMLFLAVFCGFLAEYQLEHKIESDRGRQYVLSMIEDLQSDSLKINTSLDFCKKQVEGIDSLATLFSNQAALNADVNKAYLLMAKYTMVIATVPFTKRTISQLKNSGGMRLIPNKKSADEITKYSESVEVVEYQGNYYGNEIVSDVIRLNKKLFFLSFLNGLEKGEKDAAADKPLTFANDDKQLKIEYANQLILMAGILDNYTRMLEELKAEIPKVINTLKQENHL